MSTSPAKDGSPGSSIYGDSKSPFLIGVAGGTASGKSTVCDKIMEAVIGSNHEPGKERNITALSQDSFYRELNEKESILAMKGLFNFDHPGITFIRQLSYLLSLELVYFDWLICCFFLKSKGGEYFLLKH